MDHRWLSHDQARELPRWNGAQHLEALQRHIVSGPGVLELDLEGYAAERLAQAEIAPERWAELWPLALASIVDSELEGPADDGQWVELCDGTRVRMGDCPWSLRVQAAQESLQEEEVGVESFEPVRFEPVRIAERVLEQLIEMADTPSPITLASLSARAAVQLACALLDRYDRVDPPGELDDYDELEPEDLEAEQVRMVLALHRALARIRLPAPHTPPRRERPKPRWPPQSIPQHAPLLVVSFGLTPRPVPARVVGPMTKLIATYGDG
ncbi:MAG: hypothetical protein AAGF11_20270 [Myxococcota bacterium]